MRRLKDNADQQIQLHRGRSNKPPSKFRNESHTMRNSKHSSRQHNRIIASTNRRRFSKCTNNRSSNCTYNKHGSDTRSSSSSNSSNNSRSNSSTNKHWYNSNRSGCGSNNVTSSSSNNFKLRNNRHNDRRNTSLHPGGAPFPSSSRPYSGHTTNSNSNSRSCNRLHSRPWASSAKKAPSLNQTAKP